jgi:hypothetical protein
LTYFWLPVAMSADTRYANEAEEFFKNAIPVCAYIIIEIYIHIIGGFVELFNVFFVVIVRRDYLAVKCKLFDLQKYDFSL